jgi:Icc-related predicted phosphoesterase
MKIIAISDTHKMHSGVIIDECDVLVHAGDITGRGELMALESFNRWIALQPAKHKLVIAGNHDFCFQNEHRAAAKATVTEYTYLQDEAVVIDGVKFYGTPWQPWFYNWAFNVESETVRETIWANIPDDTDVLIVHGPPHGYGDRCKNGDRPGCKKLLDRIREVKPKYVICGHIHEDYGLHELDGTTVVNASICTLQYKPTNSPIELEIKSKD